MYKYIRKANFPTMNLSTNTLDSEHPIVGYCNWSFDKKNHISEAELVEALHQFDSKCIPYYVRLFNETPPALFREFTNINNISENEVEAIYSNITLGSNRSISRDFFKENQNKEVQNEPK